MISRAEGDDDHHRQDAGRQGGSRRHHDLQQPGAAQRRVAGDVAGGHAHPRGVRQGRRRARAGGHRGRRQGVRVGRRHLQVRGRARHPRGGRALQRHRPGLLYGAQHLPEADHCRHPGLLHRRRAQPRHRLRSALLHGGLALRPARRQAGARLRLCRPAALHRHRRPGAHQGHLLLRPPVRRRRGAGDGRRQPRAARGRARLLRQGVRRHHRRECAADHCRRQAVGHRGAQARKPAQPEARRRPRRPLLCQPGLHRGPQRLHGEAQAEILPASEDEHGQRIRRRSTTSGADAECPDGCRQPSPFALSRPKWCCGSCPSPHRCARLP